MKIIRRCNVWMILLTVLAMFQGVLDAREDLRHMVVQGFRIPEYDGQGNMTSQLFGDRAEMQGEGEVKITGMRIEFYEEGETVMTVTSPYCFFNQNTRDAHSDAPIAADSERAKIRGTGFKLDSERQVITVLEDSHVTLFEVRPGAEEGAPETTNTTVITSRRLIIDYAKRTARFEEEVKVQEGRMLMHSDELDVHLGDENEIRGWRGSNGTVRGSGDPWVAHAGAVQQTSIVGR